MEKPYSLKVQPWGQLPRDAYSIITEDFVHEKLLGITVVVPSKKGTINFTNEVFRNKNHHLLTQELKLWFTVSKDRMLYFESANQEIKIHYDNGRTKIAGQQFNFYGSFQKTKKENGYSIKLGAIYFHPKFQFDNRLVFRNAGVAGSEIISGHKISFTKNKWSFYAYDMYNYAKTMDVHKNALLIGYKHNDRTSYFFRAQNIQEREIKNSNWLSIDNLYRHYAFNVVHIVNDEITVSNEINFSNRYLNDFSGVILKKFPNIDMWAKIRGFKGWNDYGISAAVQGKLGSYGRWTVGGQIAGGGPKLAIRYGAHIDLNL